MSDEELENVEQVSSEEPQEPTTSRPGWSKYAAWILVGSGFFIYMIIVPAVGMIIDALTPTPDVRELTELTLAESMRIHTVSGVVMLMFLAAGASIGSFLNVVIYRLPRGRPLLWPPSACANCGTRLSGKDNIPVIAWLTLGGRCRYCGIGISGRYPSIEAIVGVVFVTFYYRELLSGGQSLPVREPNFYNGLVWILLYTKWDLVSIYFYHMLLLVLLLACGMINVDRFRMPFRAAAICASVILGLAMAFPHLNPTSSGWNNRVAALPGSVVTSLLGCIGGILIGGVFDRTFRLRAPELSDEQNPRDSGLDDGDSGSNEGDSGLEQSSNIPFDAPLNEIVANEALQNASVDSESALESSEDLKNSVGGDEVAALASECNAVPDEPELHSPQDLYGTAAHDPASLGSAGFSFALVGAALGVEALLMVVAISGILFLLVRLFGLTGWLWPSLRAAPITLFVFGASTVFLLFWRQLHDLYSAAKIQLF